MSFGGISRGREVLRDLEDVRGKWPDTVPEWHKRNLVTLSVTYFMDGPYFSCSAPSLSRPFSGHITRKEVSETDFVTEARHRIIFL